jgi:hypothetical protein
MTIYQKKKFHVIFSFMHVLMLVTFLWVCGGNWTDEYRDGSESDISIRRTAEQGDIIENSC